MKKVMLTLAVVAFVVKLVLVQLMHQECLM